MRRRESNPPCDWERDLREGLDGLLKPMEEEAPPDVAALQMLVQQVQREQRRTLQRDLALYALISVAILVSTLYSLWQYPVYYLIAQVILGISLMAGALIWRSEGRRISHE